MHSIQFCKMTPRLAKETIRVKSHKPKLDSGSRGKYSLYLMPFLNPVQLTANLTCCNIRKMDTARIPLSKAVESVVFLHIAKLFDFSIGGPTDDLQPLTKKS